MEPTAEQIRREMQRTRQHARAEVSDVVAGARRLRDWRFYPRQFPWATVGTAAALAFAAIPKRDQVVRPDAETLEKLVREHKLLLEAKGPTEPARKGVVTALLATAGTAALRYGLSYATQQLGHRLNETLVQRTDREPTA